MEWIRILMFLTAISLGLGAHAQTWSEWFSQKRTQQKYLIEQVAALKLYGGYLKKGYEIGRSGLGFIKDASKGELDLHETFYSSLKSVNPVLRNNVKVAEIIQMQIDVISTLADLAKRLEITDNSQVYVNLVSRNIRSQCLSDMEELLMVITSGRAELQDDERLIRINALHERMKDKRDFAFSFFGTVSPLSMQRIKELKILKGMEEWYENN